MTTVIEIINLGHKLKKAKTAKEKQDIIYQLRTAIDKYEDELISNN